MKEYQSQSPDDRFLTRDGYEEVVGLIETRGIAEREQSNERLRASLNRALANIRTEGERGASNRELGDLLRQASETLAEHEKDLRQPDQPLDLQVLTLGLRAIEQSKEWLDSPRASLGINPWETQKATAALRGGVELLVRWNQLGMSVTADAIKDIAKAVGKTALSPASSKAEIGAMASAMAEVAIEEANAIRSRAVSLTEPNSDREFDRRENLNDRKALGDMIVARVVWHSVVKMIETGAPYEENKFLREYAAKHSNLVRGIRRPGEPDFVTKHPEFIPIIVGQAYNFHRDRAEEVVGRYFKSGEKIPMPIAEGNTIEKAQGLAYEHGLIDHVKNLQLLARQLGAERGHETTAGNSQER